MASDQGKAFIDQATQSLQSGQIAQGLELAEQAVEANPGSAEAHMLKAIALSQSNQPQAATEAFLRATDLAPGVAKILFNFAVHLYAQGQKSRSAELARRAVNCDRTHSAARELVKRIETEMGTRLAPGDSSELRELAAEEPDVDAVTHVEAPATSKVRAGYEPAPQHMLPLVRDLGNGWTAMGWSIASLQAGVFAYAALTVGREILKNGFAGANYSFQGAAAIGIVFGFLSVGWLIADILDRRGQWVWLVPQIILNLCFGGIGGLGFVVLPIYMLGGRRKIPS